MSKVTRVNVSTLQLVDESGRTRFFRGVNVVFKRPPWHPPFDAFDPVTSFAEEDARVLANLNINCIRLGVHWAGVEPVRGSYDPKYLAAIRDIIRLCARYGISVLIEFHQDVLAPQFCGHGVPDWVVNPDWLGGWKKMFRFPVPLRLRPVRWDEKGMPNKEDSKGLTWYLCERIWQLVATVYGNVDGLLDAFAAYWKRVVEEYKDEPNVIGYEIMNEPW